MASLWGMMDGVVDLVWVGVGVVAVVVAVGVGVGLVDCLLETGAGIVMVGSLVRWRKARSVRGCDWVTFWGTTDPVCPTTSLYSFQIIWSQCLGMTEISQFGALRKSPFLNFFALKKLHQIHLTHITSPKNYTSTPQPPQLFLPLPPQPKNHVNDNDQHHLPHHRPTSTTKPPSL